MPTRIKIDLASASTLAHGAYMPAYGSHACAHSHKHVEQIGRNVFRNLALFDTRLPLMSFSVATLHMENLGGSCLGFAT